MDLFGEFRIDAPRADVWEALNNEDVLRASIPGCKELVREGERAFSATVFAKIGVVKATFKGTVTLSDIAPPASYTITGQGQGGVAGFARGSSTVRLVEEGPSTTLLTYSARAEVGGKLASIGGRLLDAVARRMANEFFAGFVRNLERGRGNEPPAEMPGVVQQG